MEFRERILIGIYARRFFKTVSGSLCEWLYLEPCLKLNIVSHETFKKHFSHISPQNQRKEMRAYILLGNENEAYFLTVFFFTLTLFS